MRYPRLYAGPDGESHFEEVEPALTPVEFVPGRPKVDLSSPRPATGTAFVHVPAGWVGEWHPTPRRQFVVGLTGELEIVAGDQVARRVRSGDVILLEDTTGRGHFTRVASAEDWAGLLVWLEDHAP